MNINMNDNNNGNNNNNNNYYYIDINRKKINNKKYFRRYRMNLRISVTLLAIRSSMQNVPNVCCYRFLIDVHRCLIDVD